MTALSNVAWWQWIFLTSVIGTIVGVTVCRFYPGKSRLGPDYEFNPFFGTLLGVILGAAFGLSFRTPLVSAPIAIVVGFLASRRLVRKEGVPEPSTPPSETFSTARLLFRPGWDSRPRYETKKEEREVFVGRSELLDRLTSDIISRRCGTILISGVRGVGKTALVERALISARTKLQNRYWKQSFGALQQTPLRKLMQLAAMTRLLRSQNVLDALSRRSDVAHVDLKDAAENYADRPWRWWSRSNLLRRRISRMVDASHSQLLVLKFNASDIGGALAEPGQAAAGKPQINPDKLLRALIRKLYMTCHQTRPTDEARILRWSLRDKRQRQQFFNTLETAYRKSISKSYKETVTASIAEAIKNVQSFSSQSQFNVEKILSLVIALIVGIIVSRWGVPTAWNDLEKLAAGGAVAVTAFATLSWTYKRTRDITSDQARQAQLSYEFDYSLAQMEYDIQAIMRFLQIPESEAFDPLRCFTRKVIVFDELDKLENAVEQLNEVITHFKNFFTLSEALFVFITDHDFYEVLSAKAIDAQRKRQYSAEHTFFTQKIYLRKPDFKHFNETVYRFCESKALRQLGQKGPMDPTLIDFLLLNRKEDLSIENELQMDSLVHLFINRHRYEGSLKNKIQDAFENRNGWADSTAVARIWKATVDMGYAESRDPAAAFEAAGGWNTSEAVTFLNHYRSDFGDEARKKIETHYAQFGFPDDKRFSSVDKEPFTLTDLARTLCFQTKNHYFDLYYQIYDYVGSYADGAPILHMDEQLFLREPRLQSRYQRMIEAAFYHRREDHASREYFNGLLLESLYAVFESRLRDDDKVTIKDIMFVPRSPEVETKSQGEQQGKESAATKNPVDRSVLVTPREVEHINQAILRLLRILIVNKAIESDAVKASLQQEWIQLNGLADKQFSWNDDCEPVFTQKGIDLEDHEKELTEFWDQNKTELEALTEEIIKLWQNATIPEDSVTKKLQVLLTRVRTMADGLLRRTLTISRPDAQSLLTDIRARAGGVQSMVLERIRAEGDVDIFLESDLKDGPADPSLRTLFESNRTAIESMRSLLQAVVLPKETRSLVFFLSGDLRAEIVLPADSAQVLWYTSEKQPSELSRYPSHVRFYFPPPNAQSLSKLFEDFSSFATETRLREIVQVPERQKRSKAGRNSLRAGAELVGRLTPANPIISALTSPETLRILESLSNLPKVAAKGEVAQIGLTVGYTPETEWSPERFLKAFAEHLAVGGTSSMPQPVIASIVVQVLKSRLGTNLSSLSQQSFASALATSDPQQNVRQFLLGILESVLRSKLQTLKIEDQDFGETVVKDFSTWILSAIESMANTRKVDLKAVPSHVAAWVGDLERQRLSLKENVAA